MMQCLMCYSAASPSPAARHRQTVISHSPNPRLVARVGNMRHCYSFNPPTWSRPALPIDLRYGCLLRELVISRGLGRARARHFENRVVTFSRR